MKSKVKGVRLKGYLLDWAESLESGDFSYHVKEALRQYLSQEKRTYKVVEHKSNNIKFERVKKEISVNDLESKLENF